MPDRQLVVEFPWFAVQSDLDPASPSWLFNTPTNTRQIAPTAFVQEFKLDLSGYVQSDLTVGFRRSFEQVGGLDIIFWENYDVNNDALIETNIVSSVPFTDPQLIGALLASPGFNIYNATAVDFGNFNRTHIIHGSYDVMYANSTIGAGAFTTRGNANLMSVQSNVFSSLEPTAADCLYCYRIFSLPNAANGGDPGEIKGVSQITLPAKRIILDAFTVEEPDLEYMMRLKRSYELANQV